MPIALLQQTGGTNTTNNLTLGANGQYVLSGGTLTVNGNLVNNGTIDGAGGAATLAANSLVDLTSGTWKNYSDWSVDMGSSGLVIVPAGSNPASCFANFTTSGLGIHVAGTTLNVPAGKGFTGIGSINDPVACQGTVAVTSGGTINFTNGLTLSGSGSVGLGTGNLTVNDLASGISGGSLSAANQYVGSGGTGAFAHSAGTSTLSGGLYLGNNATDAGTYNLSGTGLLSAPTQYVGNSGAGTFNQAGGTNTASNNLYIGYNSTAAGTYNLSGGSLSTPTEYVGYSSAGALRKPVEQTPLRAICTSPTTPPVEGRSISRAGPRRSPRPCIWATARRPAPPTGSAAPPRSRPPPSTSAPTRPPRRSCSRPAA